jgi:hypothetical protein
MYITQQKPCIIGLLTLLWFWFLDLEPCHVHCPVFINTNTESNISESGCSYCLVKAWGSITEVGHLRKLFSTSQLSIGIFWCIQKMYFWKQKQILATHYSPENLTQWTYIYEYLLLMENVCNKPYTEMFTGLNDPKVPWQNSQLI